MISLFFTWILGMACDVFFQDVWSSNSIFFFVRLRSQPDQSFPVSVSELARLLWPQAKRQGSQKSTSAKNPIYENGVDYAVVPNIDEIILSPWCFSDLCQRMTSQKAQMIRLYFHVAEEALRDCMGETIKSRRSREDPKQSGYFNPHIQHFSGPQIFAIFFLATLR